MRRVALHGDHQSRAARKRDEVHGDCHASGRSRAREARADGLSRRLGDGARPTCCHGQENVTDVTNGIAKSSRRARQRRDAHGAVAVRGGADVNLNASEELTNIWLFMKVVSKVHPRLEECKDSQDTWLL